MTRMPRARGFVLLGLVLALIAFPSPATALILDFESLAVGDGLPQLNALLALHGIAMTVDAFQPSTFIIESDGVNKYARVHTDALGADVLFNFGIGVSFFQADFLPFSGQGIVGLNAFNANVTPSTADTVNPAYIGGTYPNLPPPYTISFVSGGDIRAIQLEEASNFLLFDNVVVPDLPDLPDAAVPEPGTIGLLAGGAFALAARSRLRTARR